MNISADSFVKEVVKSNFKTARLFQDYNIDYCCGGKKAIYEACEEAGVDAEQLISQLELILTQKDPGPEYINKLSLKELSDYIVKRHHAYVRNSIPALKKNLEKICKVHGEDHPELFEINSLFTKTAGELTMHMQKEELMLFPYINRLELAKASSASIPKSPFGSVSNTFEMMMEEHQDEVNSFIEISELSKNYQTPEDACLSYEVTLKQLKDFEDDLHQHIHLENNILFKKALELEGKFKI
ncbi:MAG: iron-sulfur cluster repair di-iron protein [Bacteroidales bacterium]|jgi:regulator of cell morphogenesis and NO signaling|nr:iron-sulfur cluster repair di-iron protein [Bacteroidales bacterium]